MRTALLLPLMSYSTATSLSFGLGGGKGSVTLQPGARLVLKLETKLGSTGFDWYQSGETPACLVASEPEYVSSTPGGRSIPGASSIKQITFTALSSCESDVIYEYVRPWEGRKDSPPTVRVHVSVPDNEGL